MVFFKWNLYKILVNMQIKTIALLLNLLKYGYKVD
jgi:hypothetical protein